MSAQGSPDSFNIDDYLDFGEEQAEDSTEEQAEEFTEEQAEEFADYINEMAADNGHDQFNQEDVSSPAEQGDNEDQEGPVVLYSAATLALYSPPRLPDVEEADAVLEAPALLESGPESSAPGSEAGSASTEEEEPATRHDLNAGLHPAFLHVLGVRPPTPEPAQSKRSRDDLDDEDNDDDSGHRTTAQMNKRRKIATLPTARRSVQGTAQNVVMPPPAAPPVQAQQVQYPNMPPPQLPRSQMLRPQVAPAAVPAARTPAGQMLACQMPGLRQPVRPVAPTAPRIPVPGRMTVQAAISRITLARSNRMAQGRELTPAEEELLFAMLMGEEAPDELLNLVYPGVIRDEVPFTAIERRRVPGPVIGVRRTRDEAHDDDDDEQDAQEEQGRVPKRRRIEAAPAAAPAPAPAPSSAPEQAAPEQAAPAKRRPGRPAGSRTVNRSGATRGGARGAAGRQPRTQTQAQPPVPANNVQTPAPQAQVQITQSIQSQAPNNGYMPAANVSQPVVRPPGYGHYPRAYGNVMGAAQVNTGWGTDYIPRPPVPSAPAMAAPQIPHGRTGQPYDNGYLAGQQEFAHGLQHQYNNGYAPQPLFVDEELQRRYEQHVAEQRPGLQQQPSVQQQQYAQPQQVQQHVQQHVQQPTQVQPQPQVQDQDQNHNAGWWYNEAAGEWTER